MGAKGGESKGRKERKEQWAVMSQHVMMDSIVVLIKWPQLCVGVGAAASKIKS